MIHLPEIIRDLGIILSAAAVVTILSKMLRQPAVLGYLIAGFLVSPHFPFLPTVKDEASVKVWAEIGVIFLLFGLGLEFSFKKLARVGKSASITALFEIVFMLGAGYLLGTYLGWSQMDSLFLGGILSISSTTIIVRAFSELGLKGNRFVSVVFGVLIVEDLVAILLLVLLSTIAITNTFSGSELLNSTARLSFFLALWFVVGIYMIPQILKRTKKYLNDETALIISIGLCLGMVILAVSVGFSPALGAFVMGSILAETSEGKRIEHLISPVKDLFGAVFFVSVGMLIDPAILREHFYSILLVTGVTIFGKMLSSSIGALLSGESLKISFQTGMSLAQIGEFSFIIATLGLTLNVTSEFLYPIAVSASAITTFTTPYLIRYSLPLYQATERVLPNGFLNALNRYQEVMNRSSGKSILALLWQAYGIKMFLNSVLVIAVIFGSSWIFQEKIPDSWRQSDPLTTVYAGISFILCSPFFWGIVFGGPRDNELEREKLISLRGLNAGVQFLRIFFAFVLFAFFLLHLKAQMITSIILTGVFLITLFLGSRYTRRVYRAVENQFLTNLYLNEKTKPTLTPWDATLAEYVLSADSELVQKSLQNSRLKERFGVMVGIIERGSRRIFAPTKDEILLPYDRLYLIGNDQQLNDAKKLIEHNSQSESSNNEDFGLEQIVLSPGSRFVGKDIRGCGIRESAHGLIVGLEREGNRILNPDSSLLLKPGDLLWIVGETQKIRSLEL